MKPRNPLTAWKRRHRRNRTRLHMIEADWPGMQETCAKIADFIQQSGKPKELAELAIDGIFEKAFDAYLGVLNGPSHTDHERLVAFIESAFATLQEKTAIAGDYDDLLRRFVRPEFWWIFSLKATKAELLLENTGDENADSPVAEKIH